MNKPHKGNRNVKIPLMVSGILVGVVITLGGCAVTGDVSPQTTASKTDPYERFNRKMFNFNNRLDDYVAEPISNAYKWITPQFMQTGVFNFFNNLKNVNVVINDVLQAKYSQSAEDTVRLTINSTLGLGGLFDVAKDVGLEQNEEDFDQTMAVWGVPRGSYLVLPVLGPSSARGIPGVVFDTAANPSSYIGLPVNLLSMLNARASAEGALKFIDEAALDPYVFTRESFLQWRENLATDGKSELSLDIEGLEDESVNAPKSKATVGKPDFTLRLDAQGKEIKHSFSNIAQCFNNTASSFEQADKKLDALKKARNIGK
jgi:phospholipid-binding lipoprotein MlaA